ncbi:MAG: alpha/beta hydrolase [Planctomycetia bacterium]|nr:alpha/beta hydrolase [Planctomycetia bacterium]
MAAAPQSECPKKSVFRRIARVILVFCLTPYLAVALLATVMQRSLIYHPKQDAFLNVRPLLVRGAVTEPVSFKAADGVELHGWHITDGPSATPGEIAIPRQDGKPVVLYFCGNANNRAERIDEFILLRDAGADVVCFDYRGYGDNLGSPSEEKIASDAREIWKFVAEKQSIDPRRIIICGESLGGGVATRLAAEMSSAGTPPGGLVLRSTFSRLTDAAAFHFPWLPVGILMFERFPSADRIPNVTCPILIFHGQQDEIIPFALGEELFAAAPQKSSQGIAKRLIPLKKANHNDVLWTEGDRVAKGVREFFDTINPRIVTQKNPQTNPMFTELVRNLTYFPERADDLSPRKLRLSADRVHAIALQSDDGLTLNGWHLLSAGRSAADAAACDRELSAGRPLVLFFSGNGGNRAYRIPEAEILSQAGADVFLFDYRGYGDNPGAPTEQALELDAHAAWRYATEQRHVARERIILYGESLGGAVATRLAAELCREGTPPGGLVLRSTFTALADVARHHYPLLPIKLLLEERYASIEQIPNVTCPILMLHGQRDSIVPFALGRKLFDAAPDKSANGARKHFAELLHADHNDVLETDQEILEKAVREFVESRTK